MRYNHLNTFERGQIEALVHQSFSTHKIAALLGRHHSTIARERQRTGIIYQADHAQQIYHEQREHCRLKGKRPGHYSRILSKDCAIPGLLNRLLRPWKRSALRRSTAGSIKGIC